MHRYYYCYILWVPLQVICRGALHGYPGSTVSTSIFKLVQDVILSIHHPPSENELYRNDREASYDP
jgi:hypothetical protein